jgi:hypothetical protein
MLEDSKKVPEAYLQTWALRIKREQKLLNDNQRLSKSEVRLLISKVFHLHKCLDHLHFSAIAAGIRDGYFINTGVTHKEVLLIGNHVDCAACALAKWPHPSAPSGSGVRPTLPFSVVSIDSLGKYSPTSVTNHTHALILVCCVTGFGIVQLLKHAPTAKDYIALALLKNLSCSHKDMGGDLKK